MTAAPTEPGSCFNVWRHDTHGCDRCIMQLAAVMEWLFRTGLAAAQYPLFFYSTCDRQYLPADLRRLLDLIDQVHLVSGFRKWGAARLAAPPQHYPAPGSHSHRLST